jgi:bifunctional non-homologous end joining protein LigD
VITHPEKVLFPKHGSSDAITKGEIAAYYEMVAPVMLPHIRARPITMERYPAGIDKKGFIQKDVSKGFPAWLERVEAPKKDGVVHHPIVTDARSLMWIVNQNTITPHVWSSRAPDLYHPDICVFDLDPSVDDQQMLRDATLGLREFLDRLGLPSWVKTSGSKGFHIVVPLDGKADSGVVSRFAHAVGRVWVTLAPDHLTQEFSKVDRGRRIYVDTGRNDYSATWSAPYAVRPKPGAPISAPCTWEEVERGEVGPQTFKVPDMKARLDAVGDVWGPMRKRARSLTQPIEKLRKLMARAGDAIRDSTDS